MPYSTPDSIAIQFSKTQRNRLPAQYRSSFKIPILLGLCAAIFSIMVPGSSLAQDWEGEADDAGPYSTDARREQSGGGSVPGWSMRTGIGFTTDPTAFLLNLELPYAFDRWVSAGPMLQLGFDDDNTIVAPTLNVSVTIPDLPGRDFDRVHPYGFGGIGFAYIDKDDRGRNGEDDAGFLINFGFGLEYELRKNVFIGSQMVFNFLPEKTVGERFFYSWQIGGVRFSF